MPLNKDDLNKDSLHKSYIKPTCYLHDFGHFCQKSFISKANTILVQVPIWRNRYRHSVIFTIKVTTKFSREFDTYLPIQ